MRLHQETESPMCKLGFKKIYTTGKKAKELYDKYLLPQTGIEAISLPSSSSANASMSLDKLVEAYKVILK